MNRDLEKGITTHLTRERKINTGALLRNKMATSARNIGEVATILGTGGVIYDAGHYETTAFTATRFTDAAILLFGGVAWAIGHYLDNAKPLDAPLKETKLADEDELSV